MKQFSYRHTLTACYLGYVSQAVVNNLGPLLFSTFQRQFNIGVGSLALLISLNFGIQLLVDLATVHFVDRIGYRAAAVAAGVFCSVGLCSMGILPFIFKDPYIGLVIAVVINAIGGGLLEVLVSPIVEALPLGNKGAAMSLLHSFYCWGFVAVVLLSTIYFSFIGIEHWRVLPFLWILPSLASLLLFSRAPMQPLVEDKTGVAPLRKLFKKRTFLLILLMMICAGASEQAMCQWASFFAEAGLGVSKVMGDLLGPCAFAVLMGLSRVFFGTRKEEQPLERILLGASLLCLASYFVTVFSPFPLLSLAGCAFCGLSVGIMWPGTFSLASRIFPRGGTAMFAMFALAGDAGCGFGPGIVGIVMKETTLNKGLFTATVFPLLMFVGILLQNEGTYK
ncbi:MAG: MFS transporter [Treponema sp.]|jgi:MFS family permease|nr:MFS transporter [Treponema sp.]